MMKRVLLKLVLGFVAYTIITIVIAPNKAMAADISSPTSNGDGTSSYAGLKVALRRSDGSAITGQGVNIAWDSGTANNTWGTSLGTMNCRDHVYVDMGPSPDQYTSNTTVSTNSSGVADFGTGGFGNKGFNGCRCAIKINLPAIAGGSWNDGSPYSLAAGTITNGQFKTITFTWTESPSGGGGGTDDNHTYTGYEHYYLTGSHATCGSVTVTLSGADSNTNVQFGNVSGGSGRTSVTFSLSDSPSLFTIAYGNTYNVYVKEADSNGNEVWRTGPTSVSIPSKESLCGTQPQNQPPAGYITQINCSGTAIAGKASDPDTSGNLSVQITIGSSGASTYTVTTSSGNFSLAYSTIDSKWKTSSSYPVSIAVRDVLPGGSSGSYVNVDTGVFGPCADAAPTFTISATCSAITISNLGDTDKANADVPIVITVDEDTQVFNAAEHGTQTHPYPKNDTSSHTVYAIATSILANGSQNTRLRTMHQVTVAACKGAVTDSNAPTFTLAANCTNITITNLDDADKSGANIPYTITIDGSTPSDLTYTSPKNGTFNVTYPSSKKDTASHSVVVTATSIKSDGSTNASSTTQHNATVAACNSPQVRAASSTCSGSAPQASIDWDAVSGRSSYTVTISTSSTFQSSATQKATKTVNNSLSTSAPAGFSDSTKSPAVALSLVAGRTYYVKVAYGGSPALSTGTTSFMATTCVTDATPTVTVAASCSGSATITITDTDANSGTSVPAEYKIDSGSWQSITPVKTADANHRIIYTVSIASDSSQHSVTAKSNGVKSDQSAGGSSTSSSPANYGPCITDAAPTFNIVTDCPNGKVSITVTDTDANTSTTLPNDYIIDGGNTWSTGQAKMSGSAYPVSITPNPYNAHTIQVRAKGVKSDQSVPTTYTSSSVVNYGPCNPCTITFNNPPSSAQQNTNFTLSWTFANVKTGTWAMTSSPTNADWNGMSEPTGTLGTSPPLKESTLGSHTYSLAARNTAGMTCNASTSVTITLPPRLPYLSAVNGDVQAGGGIARSDGTCPDNSEPGPVTITGSHDSTDGSNTSNIVAAIRNISGFGSKGSISDTSLQIQNYGPACRPDLQTSVEAYATMKGITGSANPSNISANGISDVMWFTGSRFTLHGSTLSGGSKTLYVDSGNLLIDGDITGGTLGTRSTSSTLGIVVNGDVYIAYDVSTLNNVFIWATGKVHTCSNDVYAGATNQVSEKISAPGDSSPCNRKLSINGMLMAGSYSFLRTGDGSTNNASVGAKNSEVITLLPLLYIAPPPGFTEYKAVPAFTGERAPRI